jgi:tripartite-type tricarboxylate transporter receptor subunit TctC
MRGDKMKFARIVSVVVVLLVCSFFGTLLYAADDYPSHPITLVNPKPPGGSLDAVSRLFAVSAQKYLGQPVVVVNKTGGSGMIAASAVATAKPDGYNLLTGNTDLSCVVEHDIAEGRKPKVTKDMFISLGSLTLSPPLIIVAADSPWNSISDLAKACKSRTEKCSFSSAGPNTMGHLPSEFLVQALGIEATHVPYKGGGPAVTAVIGKHVEFSSHYPTAVIPLYTGKKVKVLAVQGTKRLKQFPDIPTTGELGVKNAEFYAWIGFLAPAGTPDHIVKKLREVISQVAKDKTFIDGIETLGDEVHYMNAQELDAYWLEESKRFAKLYKNMKK